MRSVRKAIVLLAGLAAFAGVARPASADWLVTRDGARIETKGSWKVDGQRVVFTLPNGTLSSLRAAEVDLDLSALETTRALEARTAPAPAPPKREPVLRLTEKEIPPMREEGEDESSGGKAKEATPSALEVISWEKTPLATGDGIEIFGTLRNSGTNNITSPSLMVMIYSEDGGLLATNTATINAAAITAGRTANFRVAFPGVPDFAAVKFDAQGRGFRARAEGDEGAAPADEGVEQQVPPDGGAEASTESGALPEEGNSEPPPEP